MATWISIIYMCTKTLHSFLSFAHYRAASTVIPLLPKATFTPSIQPNLGLPRTRPSLTSAVDTLLAKRFSSILCTCTNHLNILWSTLANSLPIPAHLRTSSFLTLSILGTPTKPVKLHLKNIYFPSLRTYYYNNNNLSYFIYGQIWSHVRRICYFYEMDYRWSYFAIICVFVVLLAVISK